MQASFKTALLIIIAFISKVMHRLVIYWKRGNLQNQHSPRALFEGFRFLQGFGGEPYPVSEPQISGTEPAKSTVSANYWPGVLHSGFTP